MLICIQRRKATKTSSWASPPPVPRPSLRYLHLAAQLFSEAFYKLHKLQASVLYTDTYNIANSSIRCNEVTSFLIFIKVLTQSIFLEYTMISFVITKEPLSPNLTTT